MTQDDYKLWTGEAISLDDESWERLVAVAEARLASFLCLDAFPDEPEDDLIMLLANFIAVMLKYKGTPDVVSSKSVRNFTISFSNDDAANVFAQLSGKYGDIIAKYSQCNLGFDVEKTCPGAYNWGGNEYF